jgi:hypothetical protein
MFERFQSLFPQALELGRMFSLFKNRGARCDEETPQQISTLLSLGLNALTSSFNYLPLVWVPFAIEFAGQYSLFIII